MTTDNQPNQSRRSATCSITPTEATHEPSDCSIVWPRTPAVAYPMLTASRLANVSREAADLLASFGLGNAVHREVTIMETTDELRLDHPGVVLVTGPSGCGKTTLLRAVRDTVCDDQATAGNADTTRPIIDAWPDVPIRERVARLSTAGLADPFTWARTPGELSVGQRARFDAIDRIHASTRVVVIDEFLTGLDRPTARAVAWAIGKVVRRSGKVLVACTSVDDIADDLRADVIVRINWTASPTYERPAWDAAECSLHDDLRYATGSVADWHALAPLHYAAGDPGTVHSVHTLTHPSVSGPVAVAVMSYPPLACAARNLATGDEFKGRSSRAIANRINREVLLLSRVVVTPEFRCAGIGTRIVREAIERTTARYVECSTSMGKYSRFLANAGMREVPQASGPSEAALQAWASLTEVPPHVQLDTEAFIAWVDALSVRGRREARRIVWAHYHQFVVHRRTNAPPPKKVPGHKSTHWPKAFDFASRRLRERPSYWIIGPLAGAGSGASEAPRPPVRMVS